MRGLMHYGKSTSRANLRERLFRRSICNGKPKSRFAALCGNGDYGRLGLGDVESKWKPVVCAAFENVNLRSVACGGAHTLFLTEDGCVYATGLNDCGQLGISDDCSYKTTPVEVSGLPKEIVQISAGYYHSCALTADGKVYMWGKNSNGQLGLGKSLQFWALAGAGKAVTLPNRVDILSGFKIRMMALGSEHTVAVTEDGMMLSWGGGGSERLGHGYDSSIFGFMKNSREYTPRLIKTLESVKVKKVSAGLLHTVGVDEHGCCFVFGDSKSNQLGLGEGNKASGPSMISGMHFCEEVACGGYHSCFLTNDGQLHTMGLNESGCLGIRCVEAVDIPERVRGPFNDCHVYKVSCGWKHTAAISDGRLYTWGWGGSYGTFFEDGCSSGGQLGHSSDVDCFEPMAVKLGEDVKAVEVSCGFNHTAAILERS